MNRLYRIVIIMERLLQRPLYLFSLRYFSRYFGVSKSTISEDLSHIREVLNQDEIGTIETISGAAGGIRFRPFFLRDDLLSFLGELSSILSNKDRILPGGFLYMADVIFNPQICLTLGRVFSYLFSNTPLDYIVTMETKGIPMALMTAHYLNVPLVTIRRDRRITEGSTVSINYVSGSSQKIQTMSLARRALSPGSRVLIIDDFMKAGGTGRGLLDLMKEFDAEVTGLGILIATSKPEKKLVKDYLPLLILEEVKEEEAMIKMKVNPILQEIDKNSRKER